MAIETKKVRVAIYTRKSVEDAEDKQFNSIDAQRQMCENFIAAKAAEGWVTLPDRYDDYGYSGGDLDRPAYQRLMADCELGKIDKVIVFRIDRMTRSTKDFCEFDEKMKQLGVGFTSVSEPFVDTSSPMGELVVNLIVSFGQWERKTIQERIQRHFRTALDQGYFVGGVVPYGYRLENHCLVPDPETAGNVPHIFRLFIQSGSVKKVATQLYEEGIERMPGHPWTTQSVHNCVTNVRYVGDANSHGKIVKGKQPALITRDLWNKAQERIKKAAAAPARKVVNPETVLFSGLVVCGSCGHPMTYRWSRKDTLGVRKYSYFVCQQDMRKPVPTCEIRHVSVLTVQDTVERELETIMLASSSMLVAVANATTLTPEQIVTGFRRHSFWQGLTTVNRRTIYRLMLKSITVFKTALELRVILPDNGAKDELVRSHYLPKDAPEDSDVRMEAEGCLYVKVPVAFRTVSGRKQIIRPGVGAAGDRPSQQMLNEGLAQGAILKAFAKAFVWMKMIDEGKVTSISQLAEVVGTERHYVIHTLRLATLSPRIIRAALSGELPDGFSLQKVRKVETDDWEEQERQLGFPVEDGSGGSRSCATDLVGSRVPA